MNNYGTYKKPHHLFKLNGQCFNTKKFKLSTENFDGEGSKNKNSLVKFINNWIDERDFIEIETSGTVSSPKLIRIPKINLFNSAIATGSFFGLRPGYSALCCLPFAFIAGKMMFIRSWVLGLSLDIIEPSSDLSNQLSNKLYDFSAMVPLQAMKSFKYIKNIKTLLLGGAPVPQSLASKFYNHSSKVYETFGMSETVGHFAVKNLSKNEDIFTVFPDVNISVDQRECLTVLSSKFTNGIIKTNDIVSLISNREFLWLGRYDNIINSGGIKIYPEQLEKQIRNQLNTSFFITSQPDDDLGQKVILIVEGGYENKDLKFDWGKIDVLKQPKKIYFIPKFKRTISGKIKRVETLNLLNLNNS